MLIPVLILEADAEGGWLTFAYFANWVIWGVFAAEFVAVLWVAQRRRAALRAHWLDVAIVVLTPVDGSPAPVILTVPLRTVWPLCRRTRPAISPALLNSTSAALA